MRILVIKLSSMGDVCHVLPAITDAKRIYPELIVDFIVEPEYEYICKLHPAVDNVITCNLRGYKGKPLEMFKDKYLAKLWHSIREKKYAHVIDAQGLLKSALLSLIARGKVSGFTRRAVKEKVASLFYRKSYDSNEEHAIYRLRDLFAGALDYTSMLDTLKFDYGIFPNNIPKLKTDKGYVVFVHGTSWHSKEWSNKYWFELSKILLEHNISIKLFYRGYEQQVLARKISQVSPFIENCGEVDVESAVKVLNGSIAVIGVDTGFSHLGAALNKPVIALYGPTSMLKTGLKGQNVVNLQTKFNCSPCLKKVCPYSKIENASSPCFNELYPEKIFSKLQEFIEDQNDPRVLPNIVGE